MIAVAFVIFSRVGCLWVCERVPNTKGAGAGGGEVGKISSSLECVPIYLKFLNFYLKFKSYQFQVNICILHIQAKGIAYRGQGLWFDISHRVKFVLSDVRNVTGSFSTSNLKFSSRTDIGDIEYLNVDSN